MDGTGRVGGDEFEVDVRAGQLRRVPERRGGIEHGRDHRGLGRGLDAQVDEAGARHVCGGDAVGGGQRIDQPASQLARIGANLLGDLQGEVGGVVAMLGVSGPFDRHRVGQDRRVETVLDQYRGGGGLEQGSQVGGGHGRHPMV